MNTDEINAVLAEIMFEGYTFTAEEDECVVILQASYLEKDTVTGKSERQFTRRWLLSPVMSESEIVSTCFKLVMTSMEHRTREWFTYRNKAVFHPHHDVNDLLALCEEREVA